MKCMTGRVTDGRGEGIGDGAWGTAHGRLEVHRSTHRGIWGRGVDGGMNFVLVLLLHC